MSKRPTRVPPYLDYNATTPVSPEVFAAMAPCWSGDFANSASQHPRGRAAHDLVETARVTIQEHLHAPGFTTIFTSGATEANNLAVIGTVATLASRGRHILVSAVEHPSVLETLHRLRPSRFAVDDIPVNSDGVVEIARIEEMIREDTILVTVMAANHETGVVQPVEAIAELCRQRGITFHSDFTQAIGKQPFDAARIGADLISLSGHKIYGAKGIGALLLRDGQNGSRRVQPLFRGGDQEFRIRPGTVAVPLVVGLAKAVELACMRDAKFTRRMAELRDMFEQRLIDRLAGVADLRINGSAATRLPHVSNVSFLGVRDGKSLIDAIQQRICISRGSACHSALHAPSHVLAAMGVDNVTSSATMRVSLGWPTSPEEINYAIDVIVDCVTRTQRERHTATLERSFAK